MDGGGVGAAMADPLASRLRAAIRQQGPMPFSAWMEACLHDPADGFYTRGGVTGSGPDRHFTTSPALHPFFGAAVAMEAAAAWRALGQPDPFEVVEFGGGEGGLARAALAWLDAHEPALAARTRWLHAERSPAHRAMQAAGGDPRVGAGDGGVAGRSVFVVANEFVDALPFEWLERAADGAGWSRVCVGVGADGGFREALEPCPPPGVPNVAPGTRCAVMREAARWLEGLAQARRVVALVVDYGERGQRLWDGSRPDGTVRGYRGHAFAPVLAAPGEADITASVDFSFLRQAAEAAGLAEASFETQEAFLLRHGILDELNRTERATMEGASSYLRLRQLLLPTGMGTAFKVARYVKQT
ncbi:MAG: dehydrogenase [ubiquinone] 1 alpha subcomplex assembly factor 7 [Thermoplasmata archaeon]|jgi:NADH dehydrogenase [ubiquinone] 1 alpha subcomplex assembly factor 7|nr:dehydrogenase [ubiquinone] 1 alpha subcomplex assembly factor 7 [Thermoplasmata archaeon]